MKKDRAAAIPDFNEGIIRSALTERQQLLLRQCEIFNEIPSTNQYLLSTAFKPDELPRVCIAGRQTHGRGRLGRQWQSASPYNIYMSVADLLNESSQLMGCLSLLGGMAVARVLAKYGIEAGLKWPNDVLVDNRKIAGVLLETKVKSARQILLVAGVGLNVDMAGFGASVDQPWTDMLSQLPDGVSVDRSVLAGELLSEILSMMEAFKLTGFNQFRSEWQSLDLCYQQPLLVYAENEQLSGVGRGVDEYGRLCVEVEGKRRFFHGAEVSIRVNHAVN